MSNIYFSLFTQLPLFHQYPGPLYKAIHISSICSGISWKNYWRLMVWFLKILVLMVFKLYWNSGSKYGIPCNSTRCVKFARSSYSLGVKYKSVLISRHHPENSGSISKQADLFFISFDQRGFFEKPLETRWKKMFIKQGGFVTWVHSKMLLLVLLQPPARLDF